MTTPSHGASDAHHSPRHSLELWAGTDRAKATGGISSGEGSSRRALVALGWTPFPDPEAIASGRMIPGGTMKSDVVIMESIAATGVDLDLVSCKGESRERLVWQPKTGPGTLSYRHVANPEDLVDHLLAEQHAYDLIHLSSHVFLDLPDLASRFWGHVEKPVIFTATGAWIFDNARREHLEPCAKIICKSEGLRVKARDLGLPEDKLIVVPNPVDPLRDRPATAEEREAWRAAWNIPRDAPVFVAAGRISPEKRFDWLAEAWSDVIRERRGGPTPHLFLLGKAADSHAEALAIEARLKQMSDWNVHVPGWVNPRPYFAGADFVVSAGTKEGMSNVALEGAAMGRPNIAPRESPGFSDLVEHGVSGLLYAMNDQGSLVAALQEAIELAQSGLRMEAMRERAIERVQSHHLPGHVGTAIRNVYEEAVDPIWMEDESMTI